MGSSSFLLLFPKRLITRCSGSCIVQEKILSVLNKSLVWDHTELASRSDPILDLQVQTKHLRKYRLKDLLRVWLDKALTVHLTDSPLSTLSLLVPRSTFVSFQNLTFKNKIQFLRSVNSEKNSEGLKKCLSEAQVKA